VVQKRTMRDDLISENQGKSKEILRAVKRALSREQTHCPLLYPKGPEVVEPRKLKRKRGPSCLAGGPHVLHEIGFRSVPMPLRRGSRTDVGQIIKEIMAGIIAEQVQEFGPPGHLTG
jgi:hypothetical protein